MYRPYIELQNDCLLAALVTLKLDPVLEAGLKWKYKCEEFSFCKSVCLVI